MRNPVGFICVICLCFTSIALAQTTKSRPNFDANKKWELLHDATGQVLASCDASLKCEVSERLKRMIACHDQMKQAMQAVHPYLSHSGDGANENAVYNSPSARLRQAAERMEQEDAAVTMFRSIMQECVTAWTDR